MTTDCQAIKHAPRGVAALEFALTLPLMLLLVGGLVIFCSIAHARAQLIDIVGNITRGCAMMAVTRADADTCAEQMGAALIGAGQVHANACFGSPVTISHSVTASRRPASALGGPTMSTLAVTASCANWSFAPLYAFAHESEAPPPTSFSATAAVAFLSVK